MQAYANLEYTLVADRPSIRYSPHTAYRAGDVLQTRRQCTQVPLSPRPKNLTTRTSHNGMKRMRARINLSPAGRQNFLWLLAAGLLLPSAVTAQEVRGPIAGPRILDIELQPEGVLAGNLLGVDGHPLASVRLTCTRGIDAIGPATSDRIGSFTFSDLRPGVYTLRALDAIQVVRLWAPGTAPPSAISRMAFVLEEPITRGQLARPIVWRYLVPVGLVVGGAVAYRVSQKTAS